MAKRLKLIGIFCAALCLMLCSAVYADEPVSVRLDGGKLQFDTEPQIVNDRVMVPMRAIFESLGAQIFWDEDDYSVTSRYGDTRIYLKIDDAKMMVNNDIIELDAAPFIAGNRTLVPVRAISEAFGSRVDWDPDDRVVVITSPVEYNDVLNDVIINNDFRYTDYEGEYNGVSIFNLDDNEFFGMELLAISPWRGEQYAGIVNGMADDLPENVRVFCGIVPTAAEFYATDTYKTNYLSSISHVYNNLSDRVIPLNIEGAMNINLGHYMYFRTDHHWTHFGAYCAFLEFCDKSGAPMPSLDDFDVTVVNNSYLGSWGRATQGTRGYNLLDLSRDRIILYEPIVDYSGMIYRDMAMNKPIQSVELFNKNYRDYNIFIEGDNPIVHFKTSVNNGKSICIIKESYGNAFSTWLVNSYEDVYIVDYRQFNGHSDSYEGFTVREFYEMHHFDDLLVLSYPYTILADDLRQMLGEMWQNGYKNPAHVTDYVPDYALDDESDDEFEDEPLPTLVPGPVNDELEL